MSADYWTEPDYQHLLAAVRATPDDDLPRLVLAEWLCDHEEWERAEYIRVCVELARCDRAACDRCRKEWSRRRLSSYPVDLGWCDRCRTKGPFWPDVERSLELRRRKAELHGKWPRVWTEADERAGLNTYGDRGFIDRVSGSLAALIGGECGRCGGDGRIAPAWRPGHGGRAMETCPDCHGTGRTPGVLRELVRREPVRVVEVTDREPLPVHLSGGYRPPTWSGRPGRPNSLPLWLLELVRETDVHDVAETPGGPGSDLSFEEDAAARAALSDAILRWAMTPEEVTTSTRPPGQ